VSSSLWQRPARVVQGEAVARPSLTVSVAQVAVLIRERALVILAFAALVLGTVLAVGYGSQLVFVARAQLFLGEVHDAADADAADRQNEDGVSGEIEILASATLVERALSAAGLNASVGPSQGAPPRYSEWLAAGRDYAALPRPENELAVAEASVPGSQRESFVVEFIDGARYRVLRAAGKPRSAAQSQAADAESGAATPASVGEPLAEGVLGTPLESAAVSWTLLPGPVRGPRPGARYEVAVTPSVIAALEVTERLRVSAPRASGSPHYGRIVTLEFTAGSPFRAQRFLTALIDAYLLYRHERKVGKLLAREAYLEGESRSVEESLVRVEERLASERASRRTLYLGDEEGSPLLVERDRYRSAESRSLLEVARLLVYNEGFRGPAPPLATFMDSESGDASLAALSAALAEAERDLTDARQAFTEEAREVQEQKVRVADRTRAIARYVGARLERAQERQTELTGLVARSERKLDTLEDSKHSLTELLRDRDAYAETYARLLQQKGEAALVIAKAVSKDRIVDAPRAVAEPASPNFKEALSSGLFGLLAGVLWVLFRRLTAGTVQAESDARRFLGDVPVLGRVPSRRRRLRRRAAFADLAEEARVSGYSAFEEAFRLFALSLFGPGEARREVVYVTSPGPGEGKTSCASGLALALARHGRRVLLVDPSAPRATEGRAEPGAIGLEDVLAGRVALRAARLAVDAGPGELHLLSPGSLPDGSQPAPAEAFAHFIGVARARYDVVLVDVAGHLPTNAMARIQSADRVLLVIGLRHTRRRMLDELLASLPRQSTTALVVDMRPRRAARGRMAPVVALSKGGPLAQRA
jgi:succinoglycan biosynthesis transport protein ExoP